MDNISSESLRRPDPSLEAEYESLKNEVVSLKKQCHDQQDKMEALNKQNLILRQDVDKYQNLHTI